MRVAVIAHIRHRVSEPFMGGMEAHAHLLCSVLRERGHEVTLLAAAGSDDPQLVSLCEQPYEAVLPWERWRGSEELELYQHRAFARAFDVVRAGAFDVVHNNSLFPPLIDWARETRVPMLTSQHVPPFGKMAQAVRRGAGCGLAQFTIASQSQAPLWFDRLPDNVRVVYNGIDCHRWQPGSERSHRLVWSGRITPNKGLREAVIGAGRAGAALDIAGPVEDHAYFEDCMAAAGNADVEYLGQLQGDALRTLVRSASAALVTPMWDEPFGLVAAEALASGVPVIAFDRGAMREVVGPCGILVEPGNAAGLGAAIERIDDISRDACRQRAVQRFSAESMAAGYERAYEAAMDGLDDVPASASSCSSTRELLA